MKECYKRLLRKSEKEVQRKMSEKYGIPRDTLQFRLGPKFNKPGHGRATNLSKKEGESLANWLMNFQTNT